MRSIFHFFQWKERVNKISCVKLKSSNDISPDQIYKMNMIKLTIEKSWMKKFQVSNFYHSTALTRPPRSLRGLLEATTNRPQISSPWKPVCNHRQISHLTRMSGGVSFYQITDANSLSGWNLHEKLHAYRLCNDRHRSPHLSIDKQHVPSLWWLIQKFHKSYINSLLAWSSYRIHLPYHSIRYWFIQMIFW